MAKLNLVFWLLLSAWVALFYLIPIEVQSDTPVTVVLPQLTPEEIDLKHRQEIWISALEWCESRGSNAALNKIDRDGTPSYSNFQWKPTTFLYYGQMYHLLSAITTLSLVPDLLKDYELQRNIVREMVKDRRVDWYTQFPDCVKLRVGLPPR